MKQHPRDAWWQEQRPQYMEAWRRATRPGSRILFLNFAYVSRLGAGLGTVNML
jgi:hypothetical protein